MPDTHTCVRYLLLLRCETHTHTHTVSCAPPMPHAHTSGTRLTHVYVRADVCCGKVSMTLFPLSVYTPPCFVSVSLHLFASLCTDRRVCTDRCVCLISLCVSSLYTRRACVCTRPAAPCASLHAPCALQSGGSSSHSCW